MGNNRQIVVKRKTPEELIADKEAMYDEILKLESENKLLKTQLACEEKSHQQDLANLRRRLDAK